MFKYFTLLISTTFLVACGPDIPEDFFSSPYGKYSEESVDYFLEIGFCPEFGSCPIPSVRKWNSDIRIQLIGNYTQADEQELDSIISELSELTGLSIKRVTNNANISIYFARQSLFKKYIPQYDESNPQDGLFAVQSDNNNVYHRAVICIQDNLDDLRKRHLLREELTQSLGLTSDSESYTNSVFQQNPSYKPTQYSVIDKEVIKLLYDKKIKPGMNKEEVKSALRTSAQQVASN